MSGCTCQPRSLAPSSLPFCTPASSASRTRGWRPPPPGRPPNESHSRHMLQGRSEWRRCSSATTRWRLKSAKAASRSRPARRSIHRCLYTRHTRRRHGSDCGDAGTGLHASTTGIISPVSPVGSSSTIVCSSTPGGPPTNGAALPLSTPENFDESTPRHDPAGYNTACCHQPRSDDEPGHARDDGAGQCHRCHGTPPAYRLRRAADARMPRY